MITLEKLKAYTDIRESLYELHENLAKRFRGKYGLSFKAGDFCHTKHHSIAGFSFEIIQDRHCSACSDEPFTDIFISEIDLCKPNAIDILMENYQQDESLREAAKEAERIEQERADQILRDSIDKDTYERLKAKYGS